MAVPNKPKKPRASPAGEIPEFMKGDTGRGLENIEPYDIGWVGVDGLLDDIDARNIEREHISAGSALEIVVREIVRSHPLESKNKGDDARINQIVVALMGKRESKSGKGLGRPTQRQDEPVLFAIAHEYRLDTFSFNQAGRPFTQLYRAAAKRFSSEVKFQKDPEALKKRISTLKRKFDGQKDRIMLAADPSLTEERRLFQVNLEQAMAALTNLGIIATP